MRPLQRSGPPESPWSTSPDLRSTRIDVGWIDCTVSVATRRCSTVTLPLLSSWTPYPTARHTVPAVGACVATASGAIVLIGFASLSSATSNVGLGQTFSDRYDGCAACSTTRWPTNPPTGSVPTSLAPSPSPV